jgi:hypothetical protein
MMRKSLSSPSQFEKMPSYLGHLFRLSYYQEDNYPYSDVILKYNVEEKNKLFQQCRDHFGLHSVPDRDDKETRQQYIKWSTSSTV